MPVSAIIRKQTLSASYPFGALMSQKVYLCKILSPTDVLRAPLSSVHGSKILRHLSVTPNLQIYKKLTSLISKLAVEPLSPDRPLEDKVVDETDFAKFEELHKEVTGSASKLMEHEKNLDVLLQQIEPPAGTSVESGKKGKRTFKLKDMVNLSQERIRFFHVKKPIRSTVTAQFNDTYRYLQSIGLPCDELKYFPDIQRLTKEEINMCVERLRTIGIQRVFSLFLIHRALAEIQVGIAPTRPRRLLDGRTRVAKLMQVELYLNLCKMLERPDLDIVQLVDYISEKTGYETFSTLHFKVEKLLSVGATATIIWNNLDLLTIRRPFLNKKIKLYKSLVSSTKGPFPVSLFLEKSLNSFQERLSMNQDVLDIAEMLEKSVMDYQVCWGYKMFNLVDLVKKVRMCINVGVPKEDIFNYLSILNNISVEGCSEAVTRLDKSGLPTSIFIINSIARMKEAPGMSDIHLNGTNSGSKDWTSAQELNQPDGQERNTTKGSTEKRARKGDKNISHLSKSQVKKSVPSKRIKNTADSWKRSRRVLFSMIGHLLALEPEALSAMMRYGPSISSLQCIDISRNLEFLLFPTNSGGGGFTRDQIAQCPLILAHPHTKLRAVFRSVSEKVSAHLNSCVPAPDPRFLSSSSSIVDDSDESDVDDSHVEHFNSTVPCEESPSHNGLLVNESETLPPASSASAPSSSSSPSSTQSVPFSSASLCYSDLDTFPPGISSVRNGVTSLKRRLFSCPVRHLNVLQYLLERDSWYEIEPEASRP